MAEYVYLIRCNEFVKIGISYDVATRLMELQTGNPYKLELLSQFEVRNSAMVEYLLHRKFAAYRVQGEWFKLTDDQFDTVMRMCLAFEDGSAVLGEEDAMEYLRSAIAYCLEAGINVEWNREGDRLFLKVDGVNYDPDEQRLIPVK